MNAQQFMTVLGRKVTEAQPRTIRVGRTFRPAASGTQRVPFIRLAGHWLSDAGFEEGDQVSVTIAPGEIRLTRNPALPPRPAAQPELFN